MHPGEEPIFFSFGLKFKEDTVNEGAGSRVDTEQPQSSYTGCYKAQITLDEWKCVSLEIHKSWRLWYFDKKNFVSFW